MSVVIGLLVFIIIAFVLIKMLPTPPPVESQEILKEDGLSSKEVRKELRAQRAEHRAHSRAVGSSLRTANKMARLSIRLTKKL